MAGVRAVTVMLALAGCGAGGLAVPGAGTPALLARCGADRLIAVVGRPVAELPVQPARRSVRILRPGDAVTEDFSDARLNVILDARDRMTAVSCG